MTPAPLSKSHIAIIAALSCSFLIGMIALIRAHALTIGFSGSDEPAHYLNGYFVSLYLKNHLGENPLAFAKDYYLHYPKISIGHWPPAFYGFMGLLFLALPASFKVIFSINLAFQAFVTTAIGITVNYLSRTSIAIAAVITYAVTPISVESTVMFMPDSAVAAFAIAAAVTWLAYVTKPTFKAALLFSVFAATAALIKGNGWLVALIPFFHMLLTNRWRVLTTPKLYAAATIGALLVIPWYVFTAKLSAEGFNYSAGLPYASHALLFNIGVLIDNVSLPGVLLATYAAITEFLNRRKSPQRWLISATCISLIMATLTLQSMIPVDTVARYMAPALPPVLVLTFLGVDRLAEILSGRGNSFRIIASFLIAACTAFIASHGVLHLINRNPKYDMHVREIVELVNKDSGSHAVLIDGSAAIEGALIAALAVEDDPLHNYAVRASKVLAQSNFMGNDYALRYQDAAHALAAIQHLGIRYIVTVREGSASFFAHDDQLDQALQLPGSHYEKVLDLSIGNGVGSARVYLDKSVANPNVEEIQRAGMPEKIP